MRSTAIVRLVIAVAALAVAVSLLGLERDRDGCVDAARGVFLDSQENRTLSDRKLDALVDSCSGSEQLTTIALGLRSEHPAAAARLARSAAGRDPDSYVAWGLLAVTAPPAEATAAARRARALNPLSVVRGP